ncbi:MAG: enoyl-CoA hydratase/isomerase family protein [Chloroflexi bacterium]|nr:enoyl-CoA hydratase/isomerase family protein [Chloroflexota bacterium]
MPNYRRYKTLLIDKREGILTVTMNRPEYLNAMNREMHQEIRKLWPEVNQDKSVKAIILTGAGRAFSSGGDIRAMKKALSQPPEPVVQRGRRLVLSMLEVEAPIVAAVNGDAVGVGGTVALVCDIIIAAENARIGDPHVRVGLVPGDGGAVMWPLLCGIAKAKEYLMTGDLVNARDAERIGLVNRVVPEGKAYEVAWEVAQRFAKGPTKAINWTKFCVNKIVREWMNLVLDTSLGLESLSFQTEDHRRAVDAFLGKRQPKFVGR